MYPEEKNQAVAALFNQLFANQHLQRGLGFWVLQHQWKVLHSYMMLPEIELLPRVFSGAPEIRKCFWKALTTKT